MVAESLNADPEPSCSANENLYGRILASEDAYFCSQQRDSEDLSEPAKLKILDDLFKSKPTVFLQRYYRLLLPEHKKYFLDRVDRYSVDFYFNEIARQVAPPKRTNAAVRNARYLTLMKLKSDGDYFSNAKMREREPVLFDKMIGRFLTDQEKVYLRPTVERAGTLSGLLDEFDQAQRVSDRRQNELSDWSHSEPQACSSKTKGVSDSVMRHADRRLVEEDEFEPEFDSDDESEEAMRAVARRMQKVDIDGEQHEASPMDESAPGSSCEDDDTVDQEMLREEFISHMENRFLNGKDAEFFDYSDIDRTHSKEYDKIRDQDMEDKYFDED
ncbi:hypothetical protein QR680_004910 [Steinernema hermaphroditum]|uniref:CCD97-like C-terminal domain-containing protein n=1 Tax=Steinernema hermaphroditum TaxID=289476 RepID=A0AA39LUG0_9BILA|nr:hypothetical protein QR680_004910 [Steinernema hermaphroditum]